MGDRDALDQVDLDMICRLLREAFTDAELRRLWQDDPALAPMQFRLGLNSGIEDTIDTVVAFCEKQDVALAVSRHCIRVEGCCHRLTFRARPVTM